MRVTTAPEGQEVTLVKRKRHSPEQIIRKLREAEALLEEGVELPEVMRRLEISVQTYHRWKAQFHSMRAEDVVRRKSWSPRHRLTTWIPPLYAAAYLAREAPHSVDPRPAIGLLIWRTRSTEQDRSHRGQTDDRFPKPGVAGSIPAGGALRRLFQHREVAQCVAVVPELLLHDRVETIEHRNLAVLEHLDLAREVRGVDARQVRAKRCRTVGPHGEAPVAS